MDLVTLLAERLSAFLTHQLFVIGNSPFTVGTVLYLIAGIIFFWFLSTIVARWTTARFSKIDALSEAFKRRLILFLRWATFIVGAIWLVDSANLNITAAQIVSYFDGFFEIPFVHIGKAQITLWTLIYVGSLWLILIIATNRLQKWCAEKLFSRTGIEFGAGHAISVIIKYVVVSIGFIVILQSAGIDLSALTVLAGALGLGLSFGLQNITSNLVSGLIVLVERPIKVGDRIEVGGVAGDVKNIALRATTICTNDNIEIIVPNSQFISGNVINSSHSSRDVRVSIPVGVAYSSDPEQVRDILLAVASEHEGVLSTPPPSVIFKGFGDSALDFVLRVHTLKYISSPAILQSDLNFAIFKAFTEASIEIPFPQHDLYIRSGIDFKEFLRSPL